MTSSTSKRLYDLMHERHVDPDDGLPTQVTLDEIESTLHAVRGFLVEPTFAALLKIAVENGPLTYEDIGRLIVWTDIIADRARDILEEAAKVNVLARESFALAAGYPHNDQATFSDFGEVVDQRRFEYVLRGRFGDAC